MAEQISITKEQAWAFNKMLMALKLISEGYQTPEELRLYNEDEDGLGLDYEEAIEMAYENMQQEARIAVIGVQPLTIN